MNYGPVGLDFKVMNWLNVAVMLLPPGTSSNAHKSFARLPLLNLVMSNTCKTFHSDVKHSIVNTKLKSCPRTNY